MPPSPPPAAAQQQERQRRRLLPLPTIMAAAAAAAAALALLSPLQSTHAFLLPPPPPTHAPAPATSITRPVGVGIGGAHPITRLVRWSAPSIRSPSVCWFDPINQPTNQPRQRPPNPPNPSIDPNPTPPCTHTYVPTGCGPATRVRTRATARKRTGSGGSSKPRNGPRAVEGARGMGRMGMGRAAAGWCLGTRDVSCCWRHCVVWWIVGLCVLLDGAFAPSLIARHQRCHAPNRNPNKPTQPPPMGRRRGCIMTHIPTPPTTTPNDTTNHAIGSDGGSRKSNEPPHFAQITLWQRRMGRRRCWSCRWTWMSS